MDKDSVGVRINVKATAAVKQLKNLNSESKKLEKNLRGIGDELKYAFNTTAIIGFTRLIKNVTNTMIRASQKQTDYIESLHLLQSAYGSVENSGTKLVKTMSDLSGLDPAILTKSLGKYRQLSSALGIASESAGLMSENLLKMQNDIASLYDMQPEEVGKKLMSALTGETEAIKILGADVTQTALQQKAYNLGINESITNMSQAEKTILRYLAIQDQLKNSQGDYAHTINSVANQTKIWNSQLSILSRQLGAVFIPILQTTLPILNGILMAVNTIISTLLGFMGIDASVSSISEEFLTLKDGIEGASNAAKEANKSLRGFDKLNVIKTPTSGSAAGVGIGGVNSKLLAQMKEYNDMLDEANNKAREIRDKILGWLGYTQDLNGVWKHTKITLGDILVTIGLILSAIKLISKISKGFTFLKGIFGAGKTATEVGKTATKVSSLSKILPILGKLAAAAGIFYLETENMNNQIDKTIEKTKEEGNLLKGIKPKSIGDYISKVFALNFALDNTGAAIGRIIGASAKQKEETKELSTTIEKTLKNMSTNITDFTKTMEKIKINKFLTIDKDTKDQVINNYKSLFDELKTEQETNLAEEIKRLDNMVANGYLSSEQAKIMKKNLEKNNKSLNTQMENDQKTLLNILSKAAEEKRTLTDNERKQIEDIYKRMEENIATTLSQNSDEQKLILEKLKNNKIDISKEEASEMIKQAISNKDKIIENAKEQYNGVILEAQRLKEAGVINDKEYQKMIENAENTKNKTIEEAQKQYNGIYDEFVKSQTDIATWIDRDTGKVLSKWGQWLNSFKINASKTIDKVKSWFKSIFGDKSEISLSVPGVVGGVTASSKKTSYKANGGFVDKGQYFVAREKGPEMVGTIGNKTAVANNDQIVEAISSGVVRAMMSVPKTRDRVVIEATGDTKGLLDFIDFKQKEKDRQYGL